MKNHAGNAKIRIDSSDGQFHVTKPTCIGYKVIKKYPENRVCPRTWHSARSFLRNPSTMVKMPSPTAHAATIHAIAVRSLMLPKYEQKPRFERCIAQFTPAHSMTNPLPTAWPNDTLLRYSSPSSNETYNGTRPSQTAPKSRNGAPSNAISRTRCPSSGTNHLLPPLSSTR